MMNKMIILNQELVSDHNLVIVIFDYTLDNAGLIFLTCPYKYEKTYYLLIVLVELVIYGVLGTLLNFYVSPYDRIIVFLVINLVFLIVMYYYAPYNNKMDITLDILGRVLMFIVGIGQLISQILVQPTINNNSEIKPIRLNSNNNIPLYNPTKAYHFFTTLNYSHAGVYLIIDVLMVVVFYVYIIFLFKQAGFFNYFHKIFKNFVYGMNDHILYFLMQRIKVTTLGFENIYVGEIGVF